MKKLSLIVAALAAVLAAAPASALTYHSVSRSNGTSAYADWQAWSGDLVTETVIGADKTNYGNDVFVSVCTYNVDTYEGSCTWGYAVPAATALTFQKNLGGASLAPTSVDLYDDSGNYVSTQTVSANWSGTGKSQRGSFRSKTSFGGYTEVFNGTATFRNANATGSLGASLGPASYAGLVQFKSMDIVRVK